jgi:uncharacterized membrane protein
MEFAMTRTAIRHTLSALAVALLSASAASPASAQSDSQINNMMNNNLLMLAAQTMTEGESTEGLAAKKGSPEPSVNRQFTRMIVKKLDKVRRAR